MTIVTGNVFKGYEHYELAYFVGVYEVQAKVVFKASVIGREEKK
jgi:hypothetical protein